MNNTENGSDLNDDDNEIFGQLKIDSDFTNHRIAVRYIRPDIKLSIITKSFFSKPKEVPAKLLDISSKGVAIESEKKLKLNKKVLIHLVFEDQKEFSIPSKIVYCSQVQTKQYGIKFDQLNNDLGDYLLSSQNNLTFK